LLLLLQCYVGMLMTYMYMSMIMLKDDDSKEKSPYLAGEVAILAASRVPSLISTPFLSKQT